MRLSTPPLTAQCALLLALGVLAPACEQLPEVRYETEHLRIATDFDEQLCRGDLDHYELMVSTLEEQLATTVDKPIDVYLWDLQDGSNNPGWCSSDHVSGCFRNGSIYADQTAIDHELVHAVVRTLSSPAPFWSEGAAEALQSDRTFLGPSAPIANLNLDSPQLSYQTAGHFSRWLLETQGVGPYRELLRSRSNAAEAFEQTYDLTIEDAQAQYLAGAPFSYGALVSCEHTQVEQTGASTWSESIDLDCDNTDVHGGPLGMGAFRVLTISQRGYYALSTTASIATIARCKDHDLDTPLMPGDPATGDIPATTPEFVEEFVRLFAVDGEITQLDIAPGRYEVAVGLADFEPRTVQLDIASATEPLHQSPLLRGEVDQRQ